MTDLTISDKYSLQVI